MKRFGFTLIELLLVIAIMGLMGTAAVGGYRAMQQGMEERGVLQNVRQFTHTAYQRSQIDRLPVLVYCWNETLREADAEGYETEIVVGKAIAVRRAGRLSFVPDQTMLYDEFGDLRYQSFILEGVDEATQAEFTQALEQSKSGIFIYQMDDPNGGKKRSLVASSAGLGLREFTLPSSGQSVAVPTYYFQVIENDGADWHAGSAYGSEFQELQLPHNYIFGDSIDGDLSKYFIPGGAEPGENLLKVSALRPDSTGVLKPQALN